MLDLKFLHIGEANIAAFARKSDAVAFARANRWTPSDVFQAYNRFNIFWVVGQVFVDDMIIATKGGASTTIQFPDAQAASKGGAS